MLVLIDKFVLKSRQVNQAVKPSKEPTVIITFSCPINYIQFSNPPTPPGSGNIDTPCFRNKEEQIYFVDEFLSDNVRPLDIRLGRC